MKRIVIVVGVLAAVLAIAFISLRIYTKSFSPEAVATYDENGLLLNVNYCQPSAKGRAIFGDVIPYGEVWRTGANASTKISFSEDVMIEGNQVPAGNYALYTIFNEEIATIILSKNLDWWGKRNARCDQLAKAHLPTTMNMQPRPTPHNGWFPKENVRHL